MRGKHDVLRNARHAIKSSNMHRACQNAFDGVSLMSRMSATLLCFVRNPTRMLRQQIRPRLTDDAWPSNDHLSGSTCAIELFQYFTRRYAAAMTDHIAERPSLS